MFRRQVQQVTIRCYSTKPNFFTNGHPRKATDQRSQEISQLEWNLRTGRAASLLKSSIPDFFETGLVASAAEDDESLYANHIQLCYTPPNHLPAPFPKTLRVEGLPMYHASAVFVQRTLLALYSDLGISLCSFKDLSLHARQRQLEMCIIVTGNLRVTGKPTEWDVKSTYHFSPLSGLIEKHTVDSIIPAPHQVAYDALRSSILRIIGSEPGPKPAPCPSTSVMDVIKRAPGGRGRRDL